MRHLILRVILGISISLLGPSMVYAEALDMDLLLPKEDKPGTSTSGDEGNTDNSTPPETATDATPPVTDSANAPANTPPQAPAAPAAAAPQPPAKTTGDVLVMPPPAKAVNITLPGRGMKKEDVEKRFGPPVEKVEAVGKPPISRWVYQDFTVFFEGDYVLHAVLKEP